MQILGIDTTKKSAKVFLIDTSDIKQSYMVELDENIKHSEGLFLYIEKTMLENRINIGDIDGFACVVGPGSFTGIRVGMSTIKGFNKVLNKSIVSMNTFELLLPSVKNGLIVLNSTMSSCYYAKVNKCEIVETGVVDKFSIPELAKGLEVVILKEEQSLIDIEYNNIKVVNNTAERLKEIIFENINCEKYSSLEPYYLQLSQAERNLK